MTVRDFDDFLRDLDPDARGDDSPDGLKWGEPDMQVRAVGTTWMASMRVLEQAAARAINLIITHEPTFWFHGTPRTPELQLCEENGVDMSFKTDFLDEYGIAVIRAHNCWDRYPEYGIEDSLRKALGFPPPLESFPGFHSLYELPETTLRTLAWHCKVALRLPRVRVSGELEKPVQRVVMAYGASSGTRRYYELWQKGAEAIISGEQSEWGAVRPAMDMGLGVIELGHANTEAYGMEGMAQLLREHFPQVSIEHIPAGDSFQYL